MPQRLWPFLMAANEFLDYRVVLGPDIIIKRNRVDLIRTLVGEQDESQDGTVYSNSVADELLGTLSAYFRVERLIQDGKKAFDKGGRPLLRVDGVVLSGPNCTLSTDLALEWLANVRPELDEALKTFWPTKRWTPIQSMGRPIDLISSTPAKPDRPPEPPGHSVVRSPLVWPLVASVALNLLLAWFTWQGYQGIMNLEAENQEVTRIAKGRAAELRIAEDEVAKLRANMDLLRSSTQKAGDPIEQH